MVEHATTTRTAFGATPSPTRIETPRGPIECVQFGEGTPVLAVHGAMGGYDQSAILARTVGAPGFHYIAVSRPGYLGTPLSVGKSPEAQADAFAALLDALGLDRAVIMAISGGGPSALHFALRHPDRCRGLVAISTCAGIVESRIPFSFQIMKLLARSTRFTAMMQRKVTQDFDKHASRSVTDPVLRARALRDPEVRGLFEELSTSIFDRMAQRLPGTENDIRVTRSCVYPLEQIAVPTLVIHGTNDPLLPIAQHGQQLATRIPHATFLPLDGGEHAAIFTHRGEARAAVARFMREVA